MPHTNVTANEVQQLIKDDKIVLIDVREPAEFNTSHIKGAVLKPLSSISIEALPKTDKQLVIYCQKGGRGNSACLKLTKEDETIELLNLEGGIESWINANLKVEKGGSSVLPLDRQVQLTIGVLALTGSAAGFYLDPLFMIIPAFLGAGLTFAGLSGTCGLAMVMGKMPWNQKSA